MFIVFLQAALLRAIAYWAGCQLRRGELQAKEDAHITHNFWNKGGGRKKWQSI
jgi:hypothetical protein